MLKDVYDYFENLDKKQLPRNKHNLIYDGEQITNVPTMTDEETLTHPLVIDGTHYYTKGHNGEYSVIEIASTNMYNAIGIPTPPIYTIEKPAGGCQKTPVVHLATQDVRSVKDFMFSIANDLISQKDLLGYRLFSKDKWEPLYDGDTQKLMLKYMTRDCFEQLVGLFLVDELRSERDRHEHNYFFYKTKDSEKYEGVIPIDNEMMQVLHFDLHKKSNFDNFLATTYQTPNMLGGLDHATYNNRILDIKELLQDGMLTKAQIELLKRAIQYNLPKEVKRIGKNPLLKTYKTFAYDATSRLWEYHQKDLGRELGL